MKKTADNILIPGLIIVTAIICIFYNTMLYAGGVQRTVPETFEYTERMQYVVSFLGIRIGTVEVYNRQNEYADLTDETVIRLRTFSGVPFLSVYTEFYSKRGEDGYFVTSTTFDRSGGRWAYYHASRNDNETDIVVDRGYMDRSTGLISEAETDTLYPGFFVHDPLSFINILRDSAHTNNSYDLTILMDRQIEEITIEPRAGIEMISVRAMRNETVAYHIEGVLEFEGIHGLSRKYQAWISSDDRRIPLQAKVRIGIGSVTIQLEEYEKK